MDCNYSLLVCCLCTLAGLPTITGHDPNNYIHSTDLTGENHPPTRTHINRNGITDFVIHRGCMYMSGYVRSNYANDGRMDDDKRYIRPLPSTPPSFGKGCSTWENYVRSLCDTFHIPRELSDALIDCGSKYSLSALHESMPQLCLNASFSNSLSALFGKRNSPSMINIGTDDTKKNDGKRHSSHDDDHDTESMGSARFSPYILHNDPLPPIFATWCQHFSRSVRISHPFKSSNFNNTGNHWILDVYRLTNLHKMPKFYAHCFVGCGLKYVLYGFHVPLWQSLVYIQQIN